MWGHAVVSALPSVLAPFGELADLAHGARGLPSAVRAPRTADLVPLPQPEVPRHEARSTVPVLLVHGYLGSTACWTPLASRLHHVGFTNVFALRYNTVACSIPDIAGQLHHAAYEVMDRTGAERVHVVGHSLGGLVVRYAVQCLGLAAWGAIAIATPHRGSAFAYAAVGPAGPQMRPGAELLADLPPLESIRGVEWLVVDAAHDVVVPRSQHGVRGAVVPTRGHQAILRQPALTGVVTDHLLGCESRSVGALCVG